MLSTVYSSGISGINGFVVTVECNARDKIPTFDISGLPDAAVKESKNRIMSALENSGFYEPEKALTINLAPANRKKEGSSYDLAILISIMKATLMLPLELDLRDCCFIGELSLSGEIRPVNGVLCMTIAAAEHNLRRVFVPAGKFALQPVNLCFRFCQRAICLRAVGAQLHHGVHCKEFALRAFLRAAAQQQRQAQKNQNARSLHPVLFSSVSHIKSA